MLGDRAACGREASQSIAPMMDASRPNVLPDTKNAWRYLVDLDALEIIQSANGVIFACPAVLYEVYAWRTCRFAGDWLWSQAEHADSTI